MNTQYQQHVAKHTCTINFNREMEAWLNVSRVKARIHIPWAEGARTGRRISYDVAVKLDIGGLARTSHGLKSLSTIGHGRAGTIASRGEHVTSTRQCIACLAAHCTRGMRTVNQLIQKSRQWHEETKKRHWPKFCDHCKASTSIKTSQKIKFCSLALDNHSLIHCEDRVSEKIAWVFCIRKQRTMAVKSTQLFLHPSNSYLQVSMMLRDFTGKHPGKNAPRNWEIEL